MDGDGALARRREAVEVGGGEGADRRDPKAVIRVHRRSECTALGERPKQLLGSLPQRGRVANQRVHKGGQTPDTGARAASLLCHAPGVRRTGIVSLLAAAAVLAGCGNDAPPVAKLSAQEVSSQLAVDPTTPLSPAAEKLEAKAGELIDAGDPVRALDEQVKALRGTPVVVNLWAHWCKPCKVEMPILQRVALDRRGRTVFLGVASSAAQARNAAYLEQEISLPYPSLVDEDGAIVDGTGVDGLPKTIFYDASGKRVVHNGPYETEADLVADIERYAR